MKENRGGPRPPFRLRLPLRTADVIIIAAVALVSLAMLATEALTGGGEGKLYAAVSRGDKTDRYPLGEDREVTVSNNGYTLTFVIKDGEVYVTEADCPDKVCVHSPPISKAGGRIVCVPAMIIIKIIKDGGSDVDFAAGAGFAAA